MKNSIVKFLRKILRKIRGEADIEKLIKKGLVVGKNFDKNTRAIIDPSWAWLIKIRR